MDKFKGQSFEGEKVRAQLPVFQEQTHPPGKGQKVVGSSDEHGMAPSTEHTAKEASGSSKAAKVASEVESVEEQVKKIGIKAGILKKLTGAFSKGFELFMSDFVQVPLMSALELINGLEMVEATDSHLAGQGYTFKAQVTRAKAVAGQVTDMVDAYQSAGYHAALTKMIDLADEMDRANPEGKYGSDQLSDFCEEIEHAAKDQVEATKKLLEEINETLNRVRLGEKSTESILDNPIAMGTANMLGMQDATIFMAWQDFRQISSILDGPASALEAHAQIVEADLKVIEAHILDDKTEGGWAHLK